MKVAKRVYQPIWIKGEVNQQPYQRPSEERYEPIKALAEKFNRPFSVLDIGANYAYFDVRLMNDFDCTCVMMDNKFMGNVLEMNGCLDRSVVINRHVSAEELEALSKSEHFDIVLGLAVLHHFKNPKKAYEAMRNLGWWTILEVPGENDIGAANPDRHKAIHDCLKDETPDGYFPSHVSESQRPYYILENEPYLFEQTIDAADRGAPVYNGYSVETSFDDCSFVKTDSGGEEIERRPFVPGINLWNYERMGIYWPTKEYLDQAVDHFKDHPDPERWNFILGNGLTAIDEDTMEKPR